MRTKRVKELHSLLQDHLSNAQIRRLKRYVERHPNEIFVGHGAFVDWRDPATGYP